jgi:hypothetical protein
VVAAASPAKPAASPTAAQAGSAGVAVGQPQPAAQPKPLPPKPPVTPGQAAVAARPVTAQQADERRKAATRKLFARIRSLEAIIGADLRKRGSVLLQQAVDQWYAEALSPTATDVTITSAARAVMSQL